MSVICAGCGNPIEERTFLKALDRFWHIACLKCSCCRLRLDELGASVFVRSDLLLCRQDYIKLFGISGTCNRCRSEIPPDELVMRCQDKVFHVDCFNCFQCCARLHPGDKVCLINGCLFCEHEFPHLFPTSVGNNNNKWSNAKTNSSASYAPTTDLIMHSLLNGTDAGPRLNGAVRSPDQLNSLLHNNCHSGPPSSHISSGSISGIPPTQSDLISSANSHSLSPNSFCGTMNRRSSELLPSVPGSNVIEFSPTLCSDVRPFMTDKTSVVTAPEEPSPAPPARKRQKKVDSRRCPPVRVC